jgi:H/ACA ribonucleoprotein complex subunit 4
MNKLPFEVKRELLTKSEEKTSANYGCLPHKRTIEELLDKGIVNLDKPAGPTSHQICDYAKKILHAKKTGHPGTLDPNVTGVLPIGVNNGTKVMQALLCAGKEYICLMHLHDKVAKKDLEKVMQEFTGEIYQTPPLKSAVKRELRSRHIYYLEVLETKDKDVLFKVGCEAGTYIRRLCHDIGLVLGTGAHMQQLRRTRTASFTDTEIVTLHDLTDAFHFWKENKDEKELRRVVLPMEKALAHLPKIVISDHAVDSLTHGAQLGSPGVLKLESGIHENDMVAVLTQKGEAAILGKALMNSQDMLVSKKGLAVKTERVLIEKDVYPKYKK